MNSLIDRAGNALSLGSLTASFALHCLILASFLFVTWETPQKPLGPEIGSTRVRLVNLPPPPVADAAETTAISEPALGPSVPAVAESKRVSPSTGAAAVKSVAKRAPVERIVLGKRKRSVKRVEAPKPEKEMREDGPELVEKRVSELRREVERRKRSSEQDPARASVGAPAGASRGQADPELVAWLSQVRSRINANWSLLQDVRDKSFATVIGVRIADDGALIRANVEKGSGDEIFDTSALRAVHQASPLPAPPPEVRKRIADSGGLALRFTPSGMQ
jgi:protein TonB